MEQIFANFEMSFDETLRQKTLDKVNAQIDDLSSNVDTLKFLFSCIDLTSLNTDDSAFTIKEFCEKVNGFSAKYPQMPQVAAVCVYPVFSPVLKNSLKANGVNKAVVAAGFPSSQTFTDIKVAETRKVVDFGVDEVDVVISVGEFLDGNYEFILEEVKMVKDAMGAAHLKVILETGLLPDMDAIWKASLLSMEGGADFIKTSTGKVAVSATPEAAFVMLHAIKAFEDKTGKKIGFKPAGGIVNTRDALVYYSLVKEILGDGWLNNRLFRIGASRLSNHLLTDIEILEKGTSNGIRYF
ncbi:MAG: deoxyribose-phosphate aldolase [Breznakibacter sp.]